MPNFDDDERFGLLDPRAFLLAAATPKSPPSGEQSLLTPPPNFCPPGTAPTVRRMLVTGYDNGFNSTGKRPGDPRYGITKDQSVAGPGTIAAPKNYMGRTMFVPGYGLGTVHDIGGKIRGSHIDVWFPNEEAATDWGAKREDITICLPPQRR